MNITPFPLFVPPYVWKPPWACLADGGGAAAAAVLLLQTTTIAMLTGMIPVTSGCAFVAGRDVNGDMSNIRRSLGVCPQHDILYPDLTVREHLRMYAVLKGVPRSQLREAIKVCVQHV